jgi:hypothetical protein
MNILAVAFVAIALTLLAIVPPLQADEFYIVRDRNAQRAITNGQPQPGLGWSVAEGPFPTVDAAQRATGSGANPASMYRKAPNFPQVIPGKRGEKFSVMVP